MLGVAVTLRHVLQLQLTKDLLRDWTLASVRGGLPDVGALVLGTYARVLVSVDGKKVGRVCKVMGFKTDPVMPPYAWSAVSNERRLLVLSFAGQEVTVKITQLNDGMFTQAEFDAWLATFTSSFPPGPGEFEAKWEHLKEAKELCKQGARTPPPAAAAVPTAAPAHPAAPRMTLGDLKHDNPYHPFFPCPTWVGAKERYYFGRGSRGLGYHLDPVTATAAIVAEPMGRATPPAGRATPPVPVAKAVAVPAPAAGGGGWSTAVAVPAASSSPSPTPPAEPPQANPFKVDVMVKPTAAQMKEGAFAVTGAWTDTYVDVKRQQASASQAAAKSDGAQFSDLTPFAQDALVARAAVDVEKTLAAMRQETARLNQDADALAATLRTRRDVDMQQALAAEEEAIADREAAAKERRERVDAAVLLASRAKTKYAMLDSEKEDQDAAYRDGYGKLCIEAVLLKYQRTAFVEIEGIARQAERALSDLQEKHERAAATVKELSDTEYGLLNSIGKRNEDIAAECRTLAKRKSELESERKRLRTE